MQVWNSAKNHGVLFLEWLPQSSSALKPSDDPHAEHLRQVLLRRRDSAIIGCVTEAIVSIAAMALYDIRRSFLVPLVNIVLCGLALVGLRGALSLHLRKVQVHGTITTGVIVACMINFIAEAALTHAGLGSDTLPGWLVLVLLLVPYSLNLICSLLSLSLGIALYEFLEFEEQIYGLFDASVIEAQAQQLSGKDICCVCMDRRKDAVLTPCGHRAVCTHCGDQLQARGRNCPVCRQYISQVVKVFDS